ncbi:MAG: zinc ABC transporter substrate-binding protein [Alphaproteobacteria bacterium]|nr:zinc ABC transporter substrate-binding protein [Alphaproteobacteria bacterium]
MNKRFILGVLCAGIVILFMGYRAVAPKPPKIQGITIIASFSVLQDLTENIVKDLPDFHVSSLVPLMTDPHTYQPRPRDSTRLQQADVVIMNGWEFEGWIDKLITASGFQGLKIIATDGLKPRKMVDQDKDMIDPHAWHSIPHAVGYVTTIANHLMVRYPQHKDQIKKNLASYRGVLMALDQELTTLFQEIPKNNRFVVTTHDAFWYFGNQYALNFLSPIGVDTEQEPAARSIKNLIDMVRRHNIKALFVENLSNKKLIENIAQETGLNISGTLYADGLGDQHSKAATYVGMMRHNAYLIYEKLRGPKP